MPWHVFQEYWKRYDEWYERHQAIYETEAAAVEAAVADADAILEIGVGTGRFASRLRRGRRLVAGIDPVVEMLRLAAVRGVEVALATGERLPFRSSVFDTALLVVTLCFVDRPVDVLLEAKRVAKRVVSCIVPRDSSWGRYYASKRDSPFYRYARFYTLAELNDMYRSIGLEVSRCVSTLYTPPPGPLNPEPLRYVCDESAGFVCIVSR